MKMTFLIGVMGAGKSRIRDRFETNNSVIISFDECIEDKFNFSLDKSKNETFYIYREYSKTFNYKCPLNEMLTNAIINKKDIIIDMINEDVFTNEDKLNWINLANINNYDVEFIFVLKNLKRLYEINLARRKIDADVSETLIEEKFNKVNELFNKISSNHNKYNYDIVIN